MKRIFLIAVGVLFSFTIKAQIVEVKSFPEFANSENVVSMALYNEGVKNQIIVRAKLSSNPALKKDFTKEWNENYILNTTDFSKIKDLEGDDDEAGKYYYHTNNYNHINLKSENNFGPKSSRRVRFKKSNMTYDVAFKKGTNDVYLRNISIKEEKEGDSKFLFSINDKSQVNNVFCTRSKNTTTFCYCKQDKNANINCFKYWVYDSEANLMASDSITSNYSEYFSNPIFAYDNGYCIKMASNDKHKFTLIDFDSKKNGKFEIPSETGGLILREIKKIANGKFIFFGEFKRGNSSKNLTYGIFKLTYNSASSILEESVFFDRKKEGTNNDEIKKKIYDYYITDIGECYALVSEETYYQNTSSHPSGHINDQFEIFYINNEESCWKKQLPIASSFTGLMFSSNPHLLWKNNEMYLLYHLRKNKKTAEINFNKYIYAKPYLINPYDLKKKSIYKRSDLVILKFSADSNIEHQIIPDVSSVNYIVKDNDLIILRRHGSVGNYKHNFVKLTFIK